MNRLWYAHGTMPRGRRRSGGAVREILRKASSPPQIDLYPRSDGPGSSLDLPQFAAMGLRVWEAPLDLRDPAWRWSSGCLRTIGACIDGAPIRFRAVASDVEGRAEYLARDFHVAPITSTEVISGVPENFVNNILIQFGLAGVRVEADAMPAVYRGTGLGGSNLAHAAALIFASALSGVDLSLAQIYVWGTLLENNFGVTKGNDGSTTYGVSLTGGQEMLAAFQGRVFDNVHVPFAFGPHAVVSRELVPATAYPKLEKHLALVNTGRRRQPGVKSTDVNSEWMAAWAVPQHAAKHLAKAQLAYDGAEALRRLDFEVYADVMRKYRDLRTQLCATYIAGQRELALLCEEHKAEYFPVGAGGGTCLVCSPHADALEAIGNRIKQTEEVEIGRTFIPFRVRERGVRFSGFEELGFNIPEAGTLDPSSLEQP